MALQEWVGMCELLKSSSLQTLVSQPYVKYYRQLHCSDKKSDMQREFQKMYLQKGQTEENGYTTRYTRADSLRGTLNWKRACYDVSFYDLKVRFHVKKQQIEGHVQLHAKVLDTTDAIQVDAQQDLVLDSVVCEKRRISYTRDGNAVFLALPHRYAKDAHLEVTIYYHGKPKEALLPPWEGGFVWKKNHSSKVWASVACEHLGASSWWPCKDHPSDEPDSMRMTFEVQKPYKVISNGNLKSQYQLKNGFQQFVWEVENPINAYNVTFYIGNFVRYTEPYSSPLGRNDSLEFFVMPHNLKLAKDYFREAHDVLRFYEQTFGEYPFWEDGYCLVESPYAGMEHQSAIAIGPDYGKIKKNDVRYLIAKDDYLIIHETAHEWWGNSITAKDLADAWLQEGFATYSEFLFLEHKYGPSIFLKELDYKKHFILNLWPLLGPRGVNDNSFIGGDIYDKGALFIQNIRATVDNDSMFFLLLKSYAKKFRHQTVVTEDFIQHVNECVGKDLTPLFDAYLKQTNVPTLVYSYENEQDMLRFSYRWQNVPQGFIMPFTIKLSDGRFVKLWASEKEQICQFSKISHFNFLNNQIGFERCPSNYYTYFHTFMND